MPNPRRPRLLTLFLLLLATTASTGCNTTAISVDALDDPVLIVTARHDTYVNNDANLPQPEKTAALAESTALRQTILDAQADGTDFIPVGDVEAEVLTVTTRHDAYVNGDPALDPLDKRSFLGTSKLLRAVVDQAKKSLVQLE